MKNRVENLFLTKIRATFVLSNVGFPTLIDLTNLTREIPCREARVSSFMYGREPPGARGFPQDCGFCARAAGSAPGLQVFPQCRGFCSGAADSYLYNGRRSLHGALPERGGVRALFKQDARILCRGGAYRSFAGIAHGAEGSERPGRKAFAAGCKRKERFHAENPIFFSIFASIGKIVNLNAEAV